MKFKHVFLAATAALMVPGLAMAVVVDFETTVVFTNGDTQSVIATLSCPSGTQVASAGITELAGYTLQANLGDNATCEVTLADIDGYVVTSAVSCLFEFEGPADAISTCDFTATPKPFEFTINKVWNFADPTDVATDVQIEWECVNATNNTGDSFTNIKASVLLTGAADDIEVELYADPDGGATCWAVETLSDSGTDSDQGCKAGTAVAVGGSESCTITNTVFVEGIPTLNQYGMAIMVLLMLGVGFVGFRRFV